MSYWGDRLAKAQTAITQKNEKQIRRQLVKYYGSSMKKVIADFEATFDKLMVTVGIDGRKPTPADLYKLEKYWQLQYQLNQELNKLGSKTLNTLTKEFQRNYFEVYFSLEIKGKKAFNTIDKEAVKQMINQIWVADGKTFSQRVWDNTNRLKQTLNEQLLHCVASGNKSSDLKRELIERFDVSYRRADTLARTELCHIQTQAAKQRYEDYGIEYVEVLVDEDARTCDKCKELIGKKWRTTETPPLPVHPNERCCLIPVIDD